MGSLIFGSSKDRITVEMHAEGDPYGHDGCDGEGCHWEPDSHETLYVSIGEAKKLRRQLDVAIKQAQAKAARGER